MELRDRRGDIFAVARQVNNVYSMELTVIAPGSVIAAWMNDGGSKEPTHQIIPCARCLQAPVCQSPCARRL
jgi:hypothetical protein